jgi:hypothetical protein
MNRLLSMLKTLLNRSYTQRRRIPFCLRRVTENFWNFLLPVSRSACRLTQGAAAREMEKSAPSPYNLTCSTSIALSDSIKVKTPVGTLTSNAKLWVR